MTNYKAIGAFIFCGSQTIGHLQTGWNVDRVLEMTDDMRYNNAYHFIKNYPNIPVIDPKEWNNEEYLNNLKNEEYDLLFANNPCSGLSSINRNASVNQSINSKFFEVFDIIKVIKPKAFLIENAPRLVTIGTPILQQMVTMLKDDYVFNIVRDEAGNHNVPMKRMRTLITGWRKDIFKYGVPIINPNKQPICTVGDVLKNIEGLPNCEYDDRNRSWSNLQPFYDLVEPGQSMLRTTCKYFDELELELNARQLKDAQSAKAKLDNHGNIWDKSPWRLENEKTCASINSTTQYIHPNLNRDLYIREYARLMSYPDDFIFYPNECKTSTVQCIAQGVPVNFIKYISEEIKHKFEAINGTLSPDVEEQTFVKDNDKDSIVSFQHNPHNQYIHYDYDEFMNLTNLNWSLIDNKQMIRKLI